MTRLLDFALCFLASLTTMFGLSFVMSETAAWLLGGLAAGVLYVWLRGTRRDDG